MEHIPTRTTKGPANWFSGDVYIDPITQGQGATPMSVGSVHFTPCAPIPGHESPGHGQATRAEGGKGADADTATATAPEM